MADDRDQANASDRSGDRSGQAAHVKPSPWEWVLAGLSAVAILCIVGFLLYEATSKSASPPQIEVTVEKTEHVGDAYVVVFDAKNRGHTTADGLSMEGVLKEGDASVETSTVTIDYIPAGAQRKAGFYFTRDPADYRLEIRPKGYNYP